MTIALPFDDEMLRGATKATLLGLNARLGSDAAVARHLRVSRSAACKIKCGETWPSFRVAWRISRLASHFDIDLLPDIMSSEGKRTLPIPTDFEGLLNGLIADEYADSGEHLGHTLTLFRDGCLDEAERRVRQALGALHKMLAEIDARRRGSLTTGDALPAHALQLTTR